MGNTVDAAESNLAAIEELTSHRRKYQMPDEEVYIFIDAAGKQIVVCPDTNRVGWINKDVKEINWYNSGINAKMNGYSYAGVTLIKEDGEIPYGQHVIIGLCHEAMRKEYDAISGSGSTPELWIRS